MHPVLERLTRLRDRAQRVATVSSLAMGLAVLIAAAIAAGIIDRELRNDSPLSRFGILLAGILLAAVVARRRHLRLQTGGRGLAHWALLIESRCPSTAGSLSAAADFLDDSSSTDSLASQELKDSVIVRAERELARIDSRDLRTLIDTHPARRSLVILGIALAVGGGLFAVQPAAFGVAAVRWALPFGATEWPRETTLRWLDDDLQPIDDDHLVRRVAAGEPLSVYLDDADGRLPDEIHLRHDLPDGVVEEIPVRIIAMQDADARSREVAAATFVPTAGTHRLTARAVDDDRLPPLTLEVAAPPVLEEFKISIEPPQYAARPVLQQTSSVAHIRGLVGSKVTVVASVSVPIAKGRVKFESGAELPVEVSHGGRALQVSFPIANPGQGRYWFEVFDADGLSNPRPPHFDLIGDSDATPTFTLERPAEDLRLTPSSRLPYRVAARDEIGLSNAWLELRPADSPGTDQSSIHRFSLPIDEGTKLTAAWEGEWPLGDLGVKEGEAFELQGVATDAAPSEMPQEREGRSVSRRITIVSTDEMQRELAAVERTLADELSPLSEAVERDLGQLREARAAWRGARELTPEGLDALRQQADAAEAIHRRLASTGGWLERLTNLREAHEWNNLQPEESQRLRDIEELVSQAASESQPELSNSLREAIRTAEATSAAQEKKQRIVPNSEEAAAIDDALAQAESAARQSGQTLASAADQLDQRSHQLDLREALERIASEQSTLRADTVAAGNEVLAKAVADVTPQERGAVARLAERQRQILESFDRAAAHASSPSSEEGQSASENSSMPEALDSTAIAGLMNRSAGALDDFNIGDAMQAQQSLDDLLNTIRDQMKSAGDSSDQLMKDLEDADQLLKSLTKSEEEWIDAAESLSSIPSSDATLREALLQMKKQQEQSAQTMRDLTKRLRKSAPQAASTASDAAELLNRSAERLEDSEVPESVTEARRALEKLERAAEEVGREKSRANLQKQLVAYEQSRTVALALAERQSRLREETVRLEELTKDGGRLSRSQRRTLRQLADDQQSLAKDVSQASGEAPDDVARLAFDVAAATMQSAAEQLASEKVGVEVQQPQSDAERQLRMIASALAMEPPPQSSHSDAKPPEGQEGDQGEMVWLAPQIELLKQMQLDLIERTTRGTAPESPAASESEQAKLQADQQRLAELAAQILSSLVNDEEPPAAQNEIPPGLDEMESMP